MLLGIVVVSLAFVFLIYLNFRQCRLVGRFRDDFNLLVRFAVRDYRTCVFLDDMVMLHSPMFCV
jgi:hypothetical protein